MAQILDLPSYADHRGTLTVIEKSLPFAIKRVFWIYNVNEEPRGRHRHKETRQAMICLRGGCEVLVKNQEHAQLFTLKNPSQVLLLEPQDWHEMRNFNDHPILLVLASHEFNKEDYVYD